MILVDSSVWIGFIKGAKNSHGLSQLLEERLVIGHPWVLGELMVGNLGPSRSKVLNNLFLLPKVPPYEITELLLFVDRGKLSGKGLSLVDVQLLYGVLIEGCQLWTHDRNLHAQAKYYGVSYA